MPQQYVRVLDEPLGAWGRGDMFATSISHAQSLVEQGVVKLVDSLGNPILEESVDEVEEESPPKLADQLHWPEWLGGKQLAGLVAADITPSMAHAMSATALQRAKAIGVRTASALKRDLELQWTEIITSQEDERTISRKGIAIG